MQAAFRQWTSENDTNIFYHCANVDTVLRGGLNAFMISKPCLLVHHLTTEHMYKPTANNYGTLVNLAPRQQTLSAPRGNCSSN